MPTVTPSDVPKADQMAVLCSCRKCERQSFSRDTLRRSCASFGAAAGVLSNLFAEGVGQQVQDLLARIVVAHLGFRAPLGRGG